MSKVLKKRGILGKLLACLLVAMTITIFTGGTVAYAATSAKEIRDALSDLQKIANSTAGTGEYTESQINKAKTELETLVKKKAKLGKVNGVDAIIVGTQSQATTPKSTYGTSPGDEKIKYNTTDYMVAVYDDTAADKFFKEISDAQDRVTRTGDIDSTKTEITAALDTKANITEAADTLSGLKPFITTILGVICYIAILAMAVFTSFDVCYITMPVFRGKMESKAAQGGMGTRESKATGERKLAVITDDAIQAVEEAANSGKKPMVVYLKKRIGSYIAIAVVIYLLMSGNISLLVSLALKAISGVMRQLEKLAA